MDNDLNMEAMASKDKRVSHAFEPRPLDATFPRVHFDLFADPETHGRHGTVAVNGSMGSGKTSFTQKIIESETRVVVWDCHSEYNYTQVDNLADLAEIIEKEVCFKVSLRITRQDNAQGSKLFAAFCELVSSIEDITVVIESMNTLSGFDGATEAAKSMLLKDIAQKTMKRRTIIITVSYIHGRASLPQYVRYMVLFRPLVFDRKMLPDVFDVDHESMSKLKLYESILIKPISRSEN